MFNGQTCELKIGEKEDVRIIPEFSKSIQLEVNHLSELHSKIHISSNIGEYEFSMKGSRRDILKKLKALLNGEDVPFIILETQTTDYMFPKEWLFQNAVITVSEIVDKFDGMNVVEEASKIIDSAFKNRGNKR